VEFAASKWKVHAGQPVRPPIGLSTLTLPGRECNPPPPKRPALAQNCRPGAPSRGHGETSSTTAARLLDARRGDVFAAAADRSDDRQLITMHCRSVVIPVSGIRYIVMVFFLFRRARYKHARRRNSGR